MWRASNSPRVTIVNSVRWRDLPALASQQPMMGRKRDLDPARAATHDDDADRPVDAPGTIENAVPARLEAFDRLHWGDSLGGAGHVEGRRRADVDREHVVANTWMAAANDAPLDPVDTDRFGMDEACSRETRQLPQVDVTLVVLVMPSDEAGKHPGVRRLDIAGDECQSYAWDGPHAEALQDMDMGMPGAYED